MTALPTGFRLTMPDWFAGLAADLPDAVPALEDRMAIVNDLARRNVEQDTGGPFSAGVFERDTGRIVALGVNRVVPLNKSCIHAEFMALSLAQEALGTWSGVVDMVLAGAGPELEELTGFDEGPIHPDWQGQLAARGITLTMDVGRDDAIAVFRAFRDSGALVYNGRGGGRR